eukprot:scaffold87_cov89-Alexandrium_tamarense.AAC.1
MLLGDAVDDDVEVAFVSGGATWVDWYRLVFNVHDFEVVGGAKAFAPLLDAAVARTMKSVAVEIFAIVEDCCCNEMNAMKTSTRRIQSTCWWFLLVDSFALKVVGVDL